MAPVPSVCVRVPHSPSLDSEKSESPGTPVKDTKYHLDISTCNTTHDFATLAVRECVTKKIACKKNWFLLLSILCFFFDP